MGLENSRLTFPGAAEIRDIYHASQNAAAIHENDPAQAGKRRALGLPGLWTILDKRPRSSWPTFCRGDCGSGGEVSMLEFEARGLPYLFKPRQTAKIKDLIVRMMRRGKAWPDCGDGWEAFGKLDPALGLDPHAARYSCA